MNDWFKKALSLNSLRKKIGFDILWQATKENLHIQILDGPEEVLSKPTDKLKILVLAPHPDDDVFGLGGTVFKFAKNGDEVSVIYFCDGSKGNSEGIRDSSMITKRKKEATDAAKELGIKKVTFWGYKDGQLQNGKTIVKALFAYISELKPDMIFLPSFLDNPRDHFAVNEILYDTLFNHDEKLKILPEYIAMYEIWTPFFPNAIINITNVIEHKKTAIAFHASQFKSRGYDKAILAFNQYRAEMNGIKGYAEGFYISSPKVYKKLFDLIK